METTPTKKSAKKSPKPLIEIAQNETVKKSFVLDTSAATLLSEYTEFLSTHYGRKVSEDAVLGQLIHKLRSDKLFQATRQQKGTSH